MNRIIKSAAEGYLEASLDLVEKVFTDSEGEESGKLVRTLVEEIRSKRFFIPELDLVIAISSFTLLFFSISNMHQPLQISSTK